MKENVCEREGERKSECTGEGLLCTLIIMNSPMNISEASRF